MDALPSHVDCLISSVFEIQDLRSRLTFIRNKRIELQDLLFQLDTPYTEEQLQMLEADEIALGMLERAYLEEVKL